MPRQLGSRVLQLLRFIHQAVLIHHDARIIQNTMWFYVGLSRNGHRLKRALRDLAQSGAARAIAHPRLGWIIIGKGHAAPIVGIREGEVRIRAQ